MEAEKSSETGSELAVEQGKVGKRPDSRQSVTAQLPSKCHGGSLRAWSQVVAGHLVAFSVYGYSNAFGFFEAYYTNDLEQSPSAIAWAGSVQSFLILFIGAFVGRAVDAGYFYSLVLSGMALQLLGVFLQSLVKEYWQLILAQGICQGIGCGLYFTPMFVTVAGYFPSKNRALAACAFTSGTATGGVVFPLIARQLLQALGIGWTVRIMGFVILANSAIILSVMRPNPAARKGGELLAFSAFCDPWYSIFASAMFLVIIGMYLMYYYIASYAENVLGESPEVSLALLLVINAVGVPGRFIPAVISDWCVGAQNMLIFHACLAGVCIFTWAGIYTLSGLWAVVACYGFIAANLQSLMAPAFTTAGRDPTKFGAEFGMLYTIMSLGSLAGPPISGALIQAQYGGYFYAQVFAGSALIAAGILLLITRVISRGWTLQKC